MIIGLLLSLLVQANASDEVKIPPPTTKPKPVIKVPGSFKDSGPVNYYPTFQVEKVRKTPLRSTIQVTNLVMEQMPESSGEIVVTDTDTNTVGPFQYVLVRSNKVSVGQTYTVIKDMGELKMNHDTAKEIQGTPHSVQMQGEIKIVGIVKVPKLKETLWRAKVARSFNPIEVGGQLVELRVPSVDLMQKGVPAQVDGEVIGGNLDLNRRLLEPGAIIYLSSGVIEGIRVGQLIEVYSTQSTYSVRAAMVRVAHVDQQFATAVIVTGDREVQPGDRLSRPE